MGDELHVILLILGFFVVLVAAYLVTRFVGLRMMQSNGTRYLKIIDKIMIGNDKSICLIQLGKRFYLVGMTNHHMEFLGDVAEKDLIPLSIDETSFSGLMGRYMTSFKNQGQDSSIEKIKEKLEKRKETFKKL